MSVIQIYYAWVLRQFSQLFLPREVIVFITSLCKPKFRIIIEILWSDLNRIKRLDISQNLISGYFKSKPGFCHRRTLEDMDSTNIHDDSTLKKFFLQNNILGTKDTIECVKMIMILTKCNRVISCRISCITGKVVSKKDSIKILDFPFEINKIFKCWNFIVLRSTSGIFYCFTYDYFGNDCFENYKSLIEIPIRNIKKIIFFSMIRIILTNDGYVWINNSDLPNNFKQVRITNVIKIYHQLDVEYSDIYIIFLTTAGDIYSYYTYDMENVNILEPIKINLSKVICVKMTGSYCIALITNGDIYSYCMNHPENTNIIEPIKINLSKVICVEVNMSYCIALTCNYDMYMWGNVKEGMELIEDDLGLHLNIPFGYDANTPILIDRIIFDELSSIPI